MYMVIELDNRHSVWQKKQCDIEEIAESIFSKKSNVAYILHNAAIFASEAEPSFEAIEERQTTVIVAEKHIVDFYEVKKQCGQKTQI